MAEEQVDGELVSNYLGGKEKRKEMEMNTHGVSEARRFGACDALE